MSKENEEMRFSEIPSVTVTKAVSLLTDLYCGALSRSGGIMKVPSVMLWGAPGIGKSQGVRQIASRIETATGRSVHVADVRLLLFNPIDLRGIPTANKDKTLAVWLRPQMFDMDPSEDVINILFLDEITAAPQSVQAAAYQITLDRTVGEHKLPDNCIVIAAGNRVTDRSVAYRMPKALSNRLLHLEIRSDLQSWRRWAVENGIDSRIIGFLTFRQDRLMCFEQSADDVAFATPRSWEMVSNIMPSPGKETEDLYLLTAGLVGSGVAAEFRTWMRIFDKLPSIEGIFNGTVTDVPRGIDALYALVSSMAKYAADHRDDLDAIGNSIAYARKLPPDFAAVLIKDYINIEKDYKLRLMQVPEFSMWVRKNGHLLNGM